MDKTHMQTQSRDRTARRILLFWTLFIGVGAVAGAAGMLLDPSGRALGMDAMLGLKHTALRTIQCRTGTFKTL